MDINFDGGLIRVRHQLDRSGKRISPKTPQAVRNVVLAPALGRLLREHRLSAPPSHSGDNAPVFATQTGRPMSHRNAQARGFDEAAERAGINPKREKGERKIKKDGDRRPATFHDLRHGFASQLIAPGADG
jgi:integrase